MPQGKNATKKAANKKSSQGLTAEEKAAMKELLRERKAASSKEEDEAAVLAKIAEMQEPDRSMARRLHAIIKANAPALTAKTWYGMPAYAAGRQGHLLLPGRREVQSEVRHARLQ